MGSSNELQVTVCYLGEIMRVENDENLFYVIIAV